MNSEGSNEDDHGDYLHTKRKSEFLSSLYGLPYALVDTRNSNWTFKWKPIMCVSLSFSYACSSIDWKILFWKQIINKLYWQENLCPRR
jgi:hypothetical protein